jgi:hypothetical protein
MATTATASSWRTLPAEARRRQSARSRPRSTASLQRAVWRAPSWGSSLAGRLPSMAVPSMLAPTLTRLMDAAHHRRRRPAAVILALTVLWSTAAKAEASSAVRSPSAGVRSFALPPRTYGSLMAGVGGAPWFMAEASGDTSVLKIADPGTSTFRDVPLAFGTHAGVAMDGAGWFLAPDDHGTGTLDARRRRRGVRLGVAGRPSCGVRGHDRRPVLRPGDGRLQHVVQHVGLDRLDPGAHDRARRGEDRDAARRLDQRRILAEPARAERPVGRRRPAAAQPARTVAHGTLTLARPGAGSVTLHFTPTARMRLRHSGRLVLTVRLAVGSARSTTTVELVTR